MDLAPGMAARRWKLIRALLSRGEMQFDELPLELKQLPLPLQGGFGLRGGFPGRLPWASMPARRWRAKHPSLSGGFPAGRIAANGRLCRNLCRNLCRIGHFSTKLATKVATKIRSWSSRDRLPTVPRCRATHSRFGHGCRAESLSLCSLRSLRLFSLTLSLTPRPRGRRRIRAPVPWGNRAGWPAPGSRPDRNRRCYGYGRGPKAARRWR